MASETQIVNDGLIRVGADTITNLTDASDNANVANTIYTTHRDKLLRRHTWNFATKRLKLAQSSTIPVYEYDFQYPVPSDYFRLINVTDNEDGTGFMRYKIEIDPTAGKSILSSSTDVWLRYIAKITDSQQFDPQFSYCLSLSMATVFAIKIAQSNTLYKDVMAEFKEELRAARTVDSQEDLPDPFPDGTWAESRFQSRDEVRGR